jgi:carbamoyltransferase
MNIVGLNHGEINSSVALWRDGTFIAAAPEERFTRQKRTKEFPKHALQFCLERSGLSLPDCDFIAQSWNPGSGWHKLQGLFADVRTRREGYFYALPEQLIAFAGKQDQVGDHVLMSFDKNLIPPTYFIQHHRTHSANAFFLSEFEEAAIVTSDFRGEFETGSIGHGKGLDITTSVLQKLPHSLGMLYATFTELLGYRPDNDEWKVMALSAMDIPYEKYYKRLKDTVKLLDNGFFELDQSFYKGAITDQPFLYTPKLVELMGGRIGKNGEEADEWHATIAKAMQCLSEDLAYHMVNKAYDLTKSENLVLGGGFFMNCVFNGKVLEKSKFNRVYISHSPADVGNCFGAASYVAHCIQRQPRTSGFSTSYLGPKFNSLEIESVLRRRKIKFEKPANHHTKIAELLAQGEVVAVLQGEMEFGERALGNRSILGDPRSNSMKDKINSLIKFREGYRPFAPATLAEEASKFFDVPLDYECPYMEKVVQVREAYRSMLPAITHFDGSARLQTVHQDENADFHKIISSFGKLTGIPVVINTSFNINGEPVVMSPDDALNTLFNSGLEHLFIEDYYIRKN